MNALEILSSIFGWGYFLAWSLSFYPQIWLNFQRKNVSGLTFDYMTLNITGFLSYSIFNCSLKFSPYLQHLYQDSYHSQIPVQINDVVFSTHALAVTLFTFGQALYYPSEGQSISWIVSALLMIIWSSLDVMTWITVANKMDWLIYIYIFSFVKMIVTMKYIPQAWSNYKRKSTVGWSIGNVLLDLTGGTLSFMQQSLDAYNASDWTMIYGNPVKFVLALVSIAFDILFIIQHYVLYPEKNISSNDIITSKIDSSNKNKTNSLKEDAPVELLF